MTGSSDGSPVGSLAVMSSHLITSLIAQESSSGGGSGAIIQLGILLLIPFAMYFFMIRPQRRRMREQQELQRSIQVGDEAVSYTHLTLPTIRRGCRSRGSPYH